MVAHATQGGPECGDSGPSRFATGPILLFQPKSPFRRQQGARLQLRRWLPLCGGLPQPGAARSPAAC